MIVFIDLTSHLLINPFAAVVKRGLESEKYMLSPFVEWLLSLSI